MAPFANPLSFNFTSFKDGNVNVEEDAAVVREAIQITLNSMDQNNNYSVGRVTSKSLMQIWDKNSGQLTDFITTFSFVIYSQESSYGDGMAFFLADPNLPLLHHVTQGGGLGLVDGNKVLNSTQHSFVAVEFDTFHNPWDPQEDYVSYKVDLRDHLPERVIVGFSAATGRLFEVNTLKSWSFSSSLDILENVRNPMTAPAASPTPSPDSEKGNKLRLLVGIGIGAALILSLLVCALILWKKSRGKKEDLTFDLTMDDEFQKGSGPKRFGYNELRSATNKFSDPNKLGQGGFGSVYKGYLKNSNTNVAIKKISRESSQGIKEYATEVKIISQLRHRNLVQLIGWCHRKNDLLLIYEFMPNGSLDSHLYGGKSLLTWPTRYNIALSLASALLYLQEEWEQCVIHRDIKPSNIMLDSCFNAKLGDFGLARLVDHEKGSRTTLIAGTRGYIAPEYATSGKATKEADIYSFGVVLLEIASGKKPIIGLDSNKEDIITVVEWVWELYGMGKLLEAVDPKLCGEFDENQMERVLGVGLWCVHPDYKFRPCIRQVIQVLQFEAPLPILPEKMPVPTYLPPDIRAIFRSISPHFAIETTEYCMGD
ncbi:L-type lectin-domain containing receptor kinase IX.1-like isoform X2 [Arachis duranensis]|uniref:non-specific serine/threonine protein kinase n=1 Tax=Arachis duranensis TaxID=130453 RepID=A0A9C6WN29_ARADU|nr:L-type lectin-domain containing receptor kinase IX.1-like isoform X2 [Arachis duranensis]